MAIAKQSARPAARPGAGAGAVKPKPAAAAANEELVPLTEFSSGLIDDVDVTFSDVAVVTTDLNGKAPLGPYVAVEMSNDSMDKPHVEYYSVGKADDWKASENNRGLVAVSGKSRISDQSNFGLLLKSLFDASFPRDNASLAAGDVTGALVGLKVHLLRKKIERAGLIRQQGQGDREKPGTLLVSRIIEFPDGETATPAGTSKAAVNGKTNGQAAAAPAGAAAASATDDLDAEIGQALLTAVGEAESDIPKKDIPKIVNKYFKEELARNPKECNAAVVRSGKQDFLEGLGELGIEYTGSSIRMQEA